MVHLSSGAWEDSMQVCFRLHQLRQHPVSCRNLHSALSTQGASVQPQVPVPAEQHLAAPRPSCFLAAVCCWCHCFLFLPVQLARQMEACICHRGSSQGLGFPDITLFNGVRSFFFFFFLFSCLSFSLCTKPFFCCCCC